MPRQRLKIDPGTVERLASINCSNAEIAAVIGCHVRTIERQFPEQIAKGRLTGKASLKRKMWEVAMAGNVPMMMWLSKIMLGYREDMKELGEGDEDVILETEWTRGDAKEDNS